MTTTQTHTIDATDKVLGRVASGAAKLLMGKTTTNYAPNKPSNIQVHIINAGKTKMTEKRLLETLHESYSGHPGGLRFANNADIVSKKGYSELYRLAIYNMLPNNRLRPIWMKHLTISE